MVKRIRSSGDPGGGVRGVGGVLAFRVFQTRSMVVRLVVKRLDGLEEKQTDHCEDLIKPSEPALAFVARHLRTTTTDEGHHT